MRPLKWDQDFYTITTLMDNTVKYFHSELSVYASKFDSQCFIRWSNENVYKINEGSKTCSESGKPFLAIVCRGPQGEIGVIFPIAGVGESLRASPAVTSNASVKRVWDHSFRRRSKREKATEASADRSLMEQQLTHLLTHFNSICWLKCWLTQQFIA